MARKSKTEELTEVVSNIQPDSYSDFKPSLIDSKTHAPSTPQYSVKFNSDGLRAGIEYKFDKLGFIDWAKMIDEKYIVANRSNLERRKQPIPTDLSCLDDKDKLVLLWGFKKVAQLRGYRSIRFFPLFVSEGLISLECQICWRGNYETDNQEICFSGCGDAHAGNTFSFAKKYLTAIAENRAFVRAVRNSLDIPISGQDEIGPDQEDASSPIVSTDSLKSSPANLLKVKLKEKNKTFASLKARVEADKICDSSLWQSEEDVPLDKILTILGKYFQ